MRQPKRLFREPHASRRDVERFARKAQSIGRSRKAAGLKDPYGALPAESAALVRAVGMAP